MEEEIFLINQKGEKISSDTYLKKGYEKQDLATEKENLERGE